MKTQEKEIRLLQAQTHNAQLARPGFIFAATQLTEMPHALDYAFKLEACYYSNGVVLQHHYNDVLIAHGLLYQLPAEQNSFGIQGVAVHEDFRGQGEGKKLIKTLGALSLHMHHALSLHLKPSSQEVAEWYSCLGFEFHDNAQDVMTVEPEALI